MHKKCFHLSSVISNGNFLIKNILLPVEIIITFTITNSSAVIPGAQKFHCLELRKNVINFRCLLSLFHCLHAGFVLLINIINRI